MSTPTFNKKSPTIKRILREASELASSPSADYHAAPQEENLFEWHFTLRGPPGTPYSGGIYHGRITLPPHYPLRPPTFRFLTPSGRFEVNREICLSISGHHEDTWQPAWGVRTAVVALRGFMESEAGGQLGGVECADDVRERIAAESSKWRCDSCGKCNEDILAQSALESSATAAGSGGGRADDDLRDRGLAPKLVLTEPNAATADTTQPQPPPPRVPNAEAPAQQPPAQPQLQRVQTPWLDKVIATLVTILVVHVIRRLTLAYC